MNGMRLLGAVCATVLASSLGTLAACGGSPDSKEPTTAQSVSAASVSIALFDENGTRIGEGSGVMIAPRLVLTSGHLISGKHKWVVTSADGKQKATGSRGMTYDWMKYDSNKAHPRKHDVGVIHLDESIKLSAYPKLVGEKSADGTKATRLRGTGAGFEQLDTTLAKYRTSPNAWLVDSPAGETLDTGGAVYDARGILGIVSGRGMTTGKLYVARVDGLVKWLAPKVACAGGATGVRTYAGPSVDKSKEICEDAGTGTSSSGGGESTSGGPGDDTGGSCDGNNDGVCSGDCGGSNGSNGNDGSSGAGRRRHVRLVGRLVGRAVGPPAATATAATTAARVRAVTAHPARQAPRRAPRRARRGATATAATTAARVRAVTAHPVRQAPRRAPRRARRAATAAAATTATRNGSNGNNGGGAGGSQGTVGGDEGEACQGPSDNPDVCPPEPDGCVGPDCGGGKPDESVDYGNCACGSSGSGTIYLR